MEFAACPAVWLAHGIYKIDNQLLYKYFSPESVAEAKASTWNATKKRIITLSEKEALAEETIISIITWMIDLTTLDVSLDKTQEVIFQDGVEFDFKDELLINTTPVSVGVDIIARLPP